jgi:predicted MFS family arabinose efflux permease
MLAASAGVHHPTVIAPFLTDIGSDFHVSDALVGQIGTATFGAAVVVALFFAPFVNRIELTRMLTIAMLLLGVTGLLTSIVPSFWMLFPIRAFAGVAGGIAWGGSMAAVGRVWVEPNVRRSRQGFVVGALAGGPAILTPALRLIGENYSWEVAVAVHAVLYLFGCLLFWIMMPRLYGSDGGSQPIKEIYRQAASLVFSRTIGTPLSLRLVSMILMNVASVFLAGFLVFEYENGAVWIGMSFAALASGFMLASFASGRVMDIFGSTQTSLGFSAVFVIAAVMGIAWISPSPAFTAAMYLGFGLSVGVFFNSIVSAVAEAAGDKRAIALFFDGAFGPIGGMIGSALAGTAIALSGSYEGWKILLTILVFVILVPLVPVLRSPKP